ncbi:MAG: hypothetical protein AAF483_09455 [Planctomycetota bacterium]
MLRGYYRPTEGQLTADVAESTNLTPKRQARAHETLRPVANALANVVATPLPIPPGAPQESTNCIVGAIIVSSTSSVSPQADSGLQSTTRQDVTRA